MSEELRFCPHCLVEDQRLEYIGSAPHAFLYRFWTPCTNHCVKIYHGIASTFPLELEKVQRMYMDWKDRITADSLNDFCIEERYGKFLVTRNKTLYKIFDSYEDAERWVMEHGAEIEGEE